MSEVKVTITGQDNTKQATDSARRNIANLGKDASASSRELQNASNQASAAIRSLGGEFGRITPNIGGFSNGMISMTGAIGIATTAVLGLVAAGNNLAEQANAYDRIKTSFDGLATGFGQNSDAMLASLQQSSRGMISQYDLVLAANRAMLLGVADSDQELGQLMEVALARGQAMGLSATQAFNDLVTGIGRMSPMILDNLGIVTGGTKVYDDYAASIGKAADTLTDAERKQALVNTVIESSTQIVEDSKSTQVNATAVLSTAWKDFALVLGEEVAPAYDAVKLAAAGALNVMAGVMQGTDIPDWAMELQSIVASMQAVNQVISQMENVRGQIGDEAFARQDSFTGLSPLDEYNSLLSQREALYRQHIELVTGIAAEGNAKIAEQAAQSSQVISTAMTPILDAQAAGARALVDEYSSQFQRLQDALTIKVGYTGASRITKQLEAELQENIRLWQMFGYDQERIAGEAMSWFARQTDAAKTMTGSMRDASEVAAALGTTVGRALVPMIGALEVNVALLGETLGTSIAAGADVATDAVLGFAGIANSAIAGLQSSLSGFMADMHANTAEADRIFGVRTRRDGSGQLPQETRERINRSKVFNPTAEAADGTGRFLGAADGLVPVFEDLHQAGRAAAAAIAQISPNLESMLAQIPGLFGTSAVTAEDMALGEGYQNKADEYLRRLRDEVQNGKDWEGVDIKDAAAALGMNPEAAAEDILNAFQAAWQNQSLFANAENLKFIDMEAVQANIEQQLAQAEGEKNLKALFGIGTAEDVTAVASLGLGIQSGLSAWLAENGFDDAGMQLAAALGTGVKDNGGELGNGVSGGLDSWVSSDDGSAAIKDFAERLGAEISKNLNVKPNMELPDDPASDAGGARNGNAGAPGSRTGNTNPNGPAQSASANVYVTNNRMDVEQAGRDIARRMRR